MKFNFFSLLALWPLLQAVLNFISEAESIFRSPGSGASKLELVVSKLVPLVQRATSAGLIPEKLGSAIITGAPALVSIIVQILNMTGGVAETVGVVVNPMDPGAPYDEAHEGTLPSDDELRKMGFAAGDSKWVAAGGMSAAWVVTHPGGTLNGANWNFAGRVA